jgi:glycolate oxidase FAD binding subunit
VIDYRPADLTISVLAGTRTSEIRAVLAEHGQELPVDIPLPDEATIGGLVACGFAGPRRLGSGTLKDLILGCEYVRGDGLVAKAGGQVVKNVSGFEIPRLLHGSWGALAVLASINFKVTPIPKSERTLGWSFASMRDAMLKIQDIRQHYPSVTAIEIDSSEVAYTLTLRLMGRAGALDLQVSGLNDMLGTAPVLTGAESVSWWQDRLDRQARSGNEIQLVLRTRPRYVEDVVSEVGTRLGAPVQSTVSPGTGIVRMRFAPSDIAADGFWQRLNMRSLPGGTGAVIEYAPDNWKKDLDVWGPDATGRELMQAVKHQFDPAGILNRGRLFL